jgi:hypothetical protein
MLYAKNSINLTNIFIVITIRKFQRDSERKDWGFRTATLLRITNRLYLMVTNTSESTSLLDPPPILAGFIWKKNVLQKSTPITAKGHWKICYMLGI